MASPSLAHSVLPAPASFTARTVRFFRQMRDRLRLAWKVFRSAEMPRESRIGPLWVIVLKGDPAQRPGTLIRLAPAARTGSTAGLSSSTGSIRFLNYRTAAPPIVISTAPQDHEEPVPPATEAAPLTLPDPPCDPQPGAAVFRETACSRVDAVAAPDPRPARAAPPASLTIALAAAIPLALILRTSRYRV